MNARPPAFQVRPDLAALYSDYYRGASEWREIGAIDKADNVRRLCAGRPIRTVLDIGAGEGAVLDLLARSGVGEEHHALEISPSGVAAIEGRGIPTLRKVGLFDGDHVPYDDDSFDLAILSHVLEHAEHPRRLLYEAGRVARLVFVEVPLEENSGAPASWRDDGVGHINHFSHRTIRKLVQTSGFRVLAERHHSNGYALLRYKYGWRAPFMFGPKELLLRIFPRWALDRYTFVGALLCERAREGSG